MKYYFLLLVPLLLSSCRQKPAEFNPEQKSIIINEVKGMLAGYADDVRKNGLTAEVKYFDTSADFFWVPPNFTQALSYDSVVSILNESAGMMKMVDNKWDTLRIIPLTTNMATYTGHITSNVEDTFGNKASLLMWETGTVIKRADGWKLLSGQTSALN